MALPSNRSGWVALVLRLLLGGILIAAAYPKIRDPWPLFAIAIDSYQILPAWALPLAARTVPWGELALALLLISGFWRKVSSVAAAALLTFFLAMVTRAFLLKMEINCGCFGNADPLTWKTVLRDSLMLGAALLLVGLTFRKPRLQGSETVTCAPTAR
jgi:putative oxidoreductase